MCAIFCAKNGCDRFNFENETCSVATGAVSRNTATFRPKPSGTLREVARNKTVIAAPYYGPQIPQYANDGNTTSYYHSSNTYMQPWFILDLGTCTPVVQIRFLPTYESEHYLRFVDTQILLGTAMPASEGDFSKFNVAATMAGPLTSVVQWQEFELPQPCCARYVAVYKYVLYSDYHRFLEISELEVYSP
ncbi:uncharacterized protein LOC125179369 [Hyalella azteca]|uniref:Uncharacterized protein LOC125179369 n=1 Tax=Hyalella azteca TaxID=294128 RepID=A0A979FXS0_HYAAZ|nr:uncharacterized protein LOC125179369 [Hyalella azteca]